MVKLTYLTAAFLCAVASAAPVEERATKKTFFVLTGDSTTAKQSANGGGWGAGFINKTLNKDTASAINLGHNGASTVTFVQMGDWGNALTQIKQHTKDNNVFVTIQFGHNDQGKLNLPIGDYKKNLQNMAKDVVKAGGNPIIVSSVARRTFNKKGELTDTLKPYADAALQVATQLGVRQLNLWQASTDYTKAIGPDAAHRLNLKPDDNTHMNGDGSIVFGRMVADLMLKNYPKDFPKVFVQDKKLSDAIAGGRAIF